MLKECPFGVHEKGKNECSTSPVTLAGYQHSSRIELAGSGTFRNDPQTSFRLSERAALFSQPLFSAESLRFSKGGTPLRVHLWTAAPETPAPRATSSARKSLYVRAYPGVWYEQNDPVVGA